MTTSYCPQIRPTDWIEPEPTDLDWLRRSRSADHAMLDLIDELVAKALATAPQVALEQRFREYADKWERETGSLSSVTKRVMHPSYQAIIGMGEEVVPFLLRDLQSTRRDWFWALAAITQENPVDRDDAGRVDKMISSWVRWGKKKGLL